MQVTPSSVAGPLYIGTLFIVYVFYTAVFLGIFTTIPSYIKYLNIFTQIILCGVLMVRFHPFRNHYKLHQHDTMLIFGAASFLFVHVLLVEFVKVSFIHNYLQKNNLNTFV